MALVQDFRRFNFGYADSITELQQAPKLLQDGYYDLGGIEDRVLNSHEFLILGYKGSGKSAVGARLRLLALNSPSQYSAPSPILVDKIPLRQFKGVMPDSMDNTRHRNAWILNFLVRIIGALAEDGQADPGSRKQIISVAKDLEKAGVTPRNPATMKWFRANRVTTTVGMQGAASISAEFERQTDASTASDWIAYLETATRNFKSQRRHYFFVDGLDDLSLVQEGRSALLGGLIHAAADLNSLYSEGKTPIKIVVCCRTDLFSKLTLSPRGKIRRDYGLELNWYQNPRDYRTSHLVRLANMRARLVDEGCNNIFEQYFPPKIDQKRSAEFLLLQTRHTPRDLLQLLKIIQRHTEEPGVIPEDNAKAGSRDYSQTYLIDEMRDALHAYFTEEQVSSVISFLGSIHRKNFTFQEIQERFGSDSRFRRIDLDDALSALFDTNFIGNVGTSGHFFFKYRNPEASLSYNERMQIHPGLWKAFNVTARL
ncbi:P-loop ATPase, Sll1717 family [Streptomyces sp. NPDC008137]|uniref:P-loop ATPase, Sll1717 family n=1 Tax=Streptomyces sp. NPDC008137 TaxID=3364813 RepID=UPI0036F068D1